jgi:hypothetical protein
MKGDDKSFGVGASPRVAPGAGGWLQTRLPDWPRIWGACLRRTHSWPVPPRWIPRDWREELDAEGIAAACTALRNFDPTRGPTLGNFVYHQILADALKRHRQESSHALRNRPGRDNPEELSPSGGEPLASDEDSERLRSTVGRLMEDDLGLIACLFGDGWTGSQGTGSIGISQRAAIKRKQRILQELRCRLGESVEL